MLEIHAQACPCSEATGASDGDGHSLFYVVASWCFPGLSLLNVVPRPFLLPLHSPSLMTPLSAQVERDSP